MAKARFLSIFIAIFLGAGATLWGLFHIPWPTVYSFAWDSLPNYAIFLVLGAVVIEVCSGLLKIGRLAAGVIIAVGIAIFTGSVWPLLLSAWVTLASFLVGLAILVALKIDRDKVSRITTILIGAGAYGSVVGLLAHFPVNYPGLYGLALTIPLIFGWRSALEVGRYFCKCLTQYSESKWLDLVIAAVALIYFSVALMPEVGHDALATHLFIPGHLARRHEWGFNVTTYVWAVMPMMGDWLFSIGYMLAGETAARMINVGFVFALCWLIRDLVIWAGGNITGARWAVLLFLTTPLTFAEGSSLFIESVWVSFIIAGSLSVLKCLEVENDQNTHLPVAGLLLGGALAAKAITFTILPVLLLLLSLRHSAWLRWSLIRTIILALILLAGIGVIPYATAWRITGNPVFPFFNQIFKSEYWPAIAFEPPAIFDKGTSWDVLYRVTFHTEKFLESRPGASGFQWLLLFLPAALVILFSKHRKGLTLFVLAGLCVVITFHSTAYLRYVFPSFVLATAGLGIVFSDKNENHRLFGSIFGGIGCVVVSLNLLFFDSGTNYGDLSLPPMMSSSGREAYLLRHLPIRNAVELINKLNTERHSVAVMAPSLAGGINADVFYPNWYNYKFENLVKNIKSPKKFAEMLMEKEVDYVILDTNWGDAGKREIVEEATEEIQEFGTISVRRLASIYRFQKELIVNSDFSTYKDWTLSHGVNNEISGQLTVNVSSPAYQVVRVMAGHRYRNSVITICANQPSQGRLQVNWLDSKSNFISTDIRVFDCAASDSSHSMEVIAPRGASSAVVYASGHTDTPVVFKSVSFKQ